MSSRSLRTVGATIAIGTALALSACELETEQGTISLFQGSGAAATLRDLGTPDDAMQVSEIEESGPDGPMPEIAMRSFEIGQGAEEVRADFYRRCAAVGLGEPDPTMIKAEPATLCSGQLEGGRTHLMLTAECPDDVCQVTLEVHRLPF